MAILGIDLGTSSCVLSTIERGSLSIITNEVSERKTSALVSYTNKERLVGELAKTKFRSNYKTTCRYMKHLIGLTPLDTSELEYEKQYSFLPLKFGGSEDGELAGYEIANNATEGSTFVAATACLGSLFVNLKEIAEAYTNQPVNDVVISVPGWYSDRARQMIINAATIANLKCLRAFNEHSAIALDYGIYRSNTFKENETSRVVFFNIGHGSSFICVSDFTKSSIKIVSVSCDKHLGGRNIDAVLIKHFIQLFYTQTKIDCSNNPKALIKLEEIAVKVKKILSSNPDVALTDTVFEDYEITINMNRQQFETLCSDIHAQIINLLNSVFKEKAIDQTGSIVSNGCHVPIDSMSSIELIGGCTRIQWIQEVLMKYFNKPLSKTLNADETIARGCALQAAIYDPRYRVRNLELTDILLDPVTVSYYSQTTTVPELKTSVLFNTNNPLGVRKSLTFNRHQDFDIQLTPGALGIPLITRIEVPKEGVNNELHKKIKLRAKLTLSGIVNWDDAQLYVDETVEELVTEKKLASEVKKQAVNEPGAEVPPTEPVSGTNAPEAGKSQPEDQYVEVKVPKLVTKTHTYTCNIITQPRMGYLSQQMIEQYKAQELSHIQKNLMYRRMLNMKNDVESYIYSMQNSFNEELAKFTLEAERSSILNNLAISIDWLYDITEENETEELYSNKLKELKNICEPVHSRYIEYNYFNDVSSSLSKLLNELQEAVSSEAYSHVDPVKLQSLQTKLTETSEWLLHVSQNFHNQPLHQIHGKTADLVDKECQSLINFSKIILTPKPAIEQQPTTAPPTEEPDLKAAENPQHPEQELQQEEINPAADQPMS